MKSGVSTKNNQDLEKQKAIQNFEPLAFQVYLQNDDFTPMEFVIATLETFFYMERRLAAEIMLEAHTKGKGACGIYTKDIAETKISQVIEHARLNEYPLICSMEAVR